MPLKLGKRPVIFPNFTFNEPLKDINYCTHTGKSMNPTLSPRDLLEIEPCSHVFIGDIILFRCKDKLIVHRVVGITQEGIMTRGDNNNINDSELLTPQDIVGKVVAAWQGHKRHKIHNGLMGRLFARYIRKRSNLCRGIIKILIPFYYFVASWGVLQWLTSPFVNPTIVRFDYEGQNFIRLMIGAHIIGYYDQHLDHWVINPPFLLFIDKRVLHRIDIVV
jgi:signal peptidase I